MTEKEYLRKREAHWRSKHRILRLPEVMDITGLSRTTIWRMEEKGKFPMRKKLSDRAIGWFESDIQKWIDAREE